MFIHDNSRQKLRAKNIAPLMQQIWQLKMQINDDFCIDINDIISVDSTHINSDLKQQINDLLYALKPWRKGPFRFFDTKIQTEWDSSIKYNLIKNHLHIKDKSIADIGCNNGYYMFRMLPLAPKKITGFDTSAFCKAQFEFINTFIQSEIKFELLGLEDLNIYDEKFDFIICLGVLYHRTNPIDSLKILKNALNKNGQILIDCLIIESDKEIALSPLRYAKMKNVYFIPSVKTLQNWLIRAGFKNITLINKRKTDFLEQHKTEWIQGESLEDFLDKKDLSKTIEGYPAPIRVYIKGEV